MGGQMYMSIMGKGDKLWSGFFGLRQRSSGWLLWTQ